MMKNDIPAPLPLEPDCLPHLQKPVVLGLSGGRDSVALLHLLVQQEDLLVNYVLLIDHVFHLIHIGRKLTFQFGNLRLILLQLFFPLVDLFFNFRRGFFCADIGG